MADLPPPSVPSNARVLVRPRVHAAPGDMPLPLDRFIAPLVDTGRAALIHLSGGPGSGKSSALAYLRARFPGATFDFHDVAIFDNARLDGIQLQRAALTNTRFVRASLRSATFERARFQGTDFSHADFGSARCVACDFRDCSLDGATFQDARLPASNFDGVNLVAPDFSAAFLNRSLFTGSRMPGANFNRADLRDTGLADVEWPDADLRSADFRGATFHMGSSRSGLVGSPLASEGTRTGFYSDDYLDQTHKSPEEIRKANLCGADLRGAHVEDTDFYLVDLRDASYTQEQARHFSNCGAILHTRTTR